MSVLTENPELVMIALAACVRKLGGSVVVKDEETKPFSVASKLENGELHIIVMDYAPEMGGRAQ